MGSYGWGDGLYLSVDIYFSAYLDGYGRRLCWSSTDGNDAICYSYLPDFGQICAYVMVDWVVLLDECVFVSEEEWTGTDGEWHNLTLHLEGNSLEMLRDDAVDFSLDDDSLLYFQKEGYIQLNTIGSLCCFDNVMLMSLESHLCGDANTSGAVDIDDAVYLINFIFAGGPAPEPMESGDVDCSGGVDIDDVVYLITFIFASGPPPCDNCP